MKEIDAKVDAVLAAIATEGTLWEVSGYMVDLLPLPIERRPLNAQVLRDRLIAWLVGIEVLAFDDLSLKLRQRPIAASITAI